MIFTVFDFIPDTVVDFTHSIVFSFIFYGFADYFDFWVY